MIDIDCSRDGPLIEISNENEPPTALVDTGGGLTLVQRRFAKLHYYTHLYKPRDRILRTTGDHIVYPDASVGLCVKIGEAKLKVNALVVHSSQN